MRMTLRDLIFGVSLLLLLTGYAQVIRAEDEPSKDKEGKKVVKSSGPETGREIAHRAESHARKHRMPKEVLIGYLNQLRDNMWFGHHPLATKERKHLKHQFHRKHWFKDRNRKWKIRHRYESVSDRSHLNEYIGKYPRLKDHLKTRLKAVTKNRNLRQKLEQESARNRAAHNKKRWKEKHNE